VCVCVCVCVCVYVCTCVRVYVCTCVRVYVCTCVTYQQLLLIYHELHDATMMRVNLLIGSSVFSCFCVYELISIFGFLTLGTTVSSNIIYDCTHDAHSRELLTTTRHLPRVMCSHDNKVC